MSKEHDDDFVYPVTIGNQVTWYPKSQRWRIEVAEPSTMVAVWIAHRVLCGIIADVSLDLTLVSGLIQIHRAAVERRIGEAEMENWPDRLGILPQGMNGFYQRGRGSAFER